MERICFICVNSLRNLAAFHQIGYQISKEKDWARKHVMYHLCEWHDSQHSIPNHKTQFWNPSVFKKMIYIWNFHGTVLQICNCLMLYNQLLWSSKTQVTLSDTTAPSTTIFLRRIACSHIMVGLLCYAKTLSKSGSRTVCLILILVAWNLKYLSLERHSFWDFLMQNF